MPYRAKPIPDLVRVGSVEHYNAVKNLYRRACKVAKQMSGFHYDEWDWWIVHIRDAFETGRQMEDHGEILETMKSLEEFLAYVHVRLPHEVYPWDGPAGSAFLRYPMVPMKRYIHSEGETMYENWWIDFTTDEWFAKKEIEKWKGRYITVFRDMTLTVRDYPAWIYLKKRLEEELKYLCEHVQSQMNVSSFDWWMEYPYNVINEFSDGYKPDWSLDIAFHDHWDEDLWKHVASLEYEEREYPKIHDFVRSYRSEPIGSHGRFIPK